MAGTYIYFGGKSIKMEESVVNETDDKDPMKDLGNGVVETAIDDGGMEKSVAKDAERKDIVIKEPIRTGASNAVKSDRIEVDRVVEKLNEEPEQKNTDQKPSDTLTDQGKDNKPNEASPKHIPNPEIKLTSIFDNPRFPDFIANTPDIPYFSQNLGDFRFDKSTNEDEGFVDSKNNPSLTVIFDEELPDDEQSSKPYGTEDSFNNSFEPSLDLHSDLEARPSLTDVRSREYDQNKSDKKEAKVTNTQNKESNNEMGHKDEKESMTTKETQQRRTIKQNLFEDEETTTKSKDIEEANKIQQNIAENYVSNKNVNVNPLDLLRVQTNTDKIEVTMIDALKTSYVKETIDRSKTGITDDEPVEKTNQIERNQPVINESGNTTNIQNIEDVSAKKPDSEELKSRQDEKTIIIAVGTIPLAEVKANQTDEENGTKTKTDDDIDSGTKETKTTSDSINEANAIGAFDDVKITATTSDCTNERNKSDLKAVLVKSDVLKTTEEVQPRFPEILENIRIFMPSEILVSEKIESDQIVPQIDPTLQQTNSNENQCFIKAFVPNIIKVVPKTFDSYSHPLPCIINITPIVNNVEQVQCPMGFSQNRLRIIEAEHNEQTLVSDQPQIPQSIKESNPEPIHCYTEDYITNDILPTVFKSISKNENLRELNDKSSRSDVKSIERPPTPFAEDITNENIVKDAIEAIESMSKVSVSFNLSSSDYIDSTQSGESIKSPPRPPPRLKKDTKKVKMNFFKKLFGISSKK